MDFIFGDVEVCCLVGIVLSARLRLRLYTRNELMVAAVFVRSVLGVSPSAFEDVCNVMGPENAATVIACILEKGGHTNSAGGYLRDLTQPTERANSRGGRC